jgi:hypothetical protein
VAIEPAAIDALIETMRRHGFDTVFGDTDLLSRARVIPFIHRGSGIPLDVVLAGPGLEQEFPRRAVSLDIEGKGIPVISPEDLMERRLWPGVPKTSKTSAP